MFPAKSFKSLIAFSISFQLAIPTVECMFFMEIPGKTTDFGIVTI